MRRKASRLMVLVCIALVALGACLFLLPPALSAQSPTVVLNEVLPASLNVDWDGDGTANNQDEWTVNAK